jgi:glucose/arabinose dehydrogenase
MFRKIQAGLALAVGLVAAPLLHAQAEQGPRNAPQLEPAFAGQTRAPAMKSGLALSAVPFAEGLAHPWGIAALPDGGYLLTERPGRLRVVSAPVRGLPEVLAERQGGLLDVAVGPGFAEDRVIYWTYSKPIGWGRSVTAAARGVLSADMSVVTGVRDIFVQEPPSRTPMHYGARIVFDGAGHAFITTGEHSSRAERRRAQDLGTTYGKVIRVNLDGSVPEDNPFVGREGIDTIWSYGHRNMQGAAIQPETGALWTIEHGPAGGDELNSP